MKEFRNKGLAQKAFEEVEKIHGHDNWKLDTILQEEGNCYLYEKLGYKRTGLVENINDKMDIVYYEKKLNNFQFSNEGRCAECPKNASGIPMNLSAQQNSLCRTEL